MKDTKERVGPSLQFTITSADQSKAGRVRQLLGEIEAAHQNGFSYDKILDALRKQDLEITNGSLRQMMLRIRKKRQTATTATAPIKQAAHESGQNAARAVPAVHARSTELNLSKDGYRNPMPTFQRDVTKRLNLDE
ncbi:hypothetical protein [Caballeronia sp. Sq4a]|uniref:hypothetical protein n=1 Tax=Caballeronia sp. Sq4a TaxID=2878152 RepID=UPI0020BF71F2|nr:hypothetical protein [Caballeronia sp. Sq4a]